MRVHVTLLVAVLVVIACDSTTGPPSLSPVGFLQPTEAAGSTGYAATLLPDGDVTAVHQSFLTLNDSGDIFGSLQEDATGPERAVRWNADASGNVTGPVRLGELPTPFDNTDQSVLAANQNGVVIGYARDFEADLSAGWVWVDGVMTLLLPLPGEEYPQVYPEGVSAEGVVVGQVRSAPGDDWQTYAAVWFPPYDAAPLLLPVMEGYALNSARAITSAGLVTGWVRGSEVPDLYVEWQIDPSGNVISGPTKLEGSYDQLMGGVNSDRDVAASYHGGTPGAEAALYRSDVALSINLGMFDGHTQSTGRSLTARDQDGKILLAGYSYTEWSAEHDDRTAAIWTVYADGTLVGPLDPGPPAAYPNNSPSNRFETATALSINSAGWTVGESRRADGRIFATLWRPNQSSDDDAPPSGDGPVASFDYSCANSATCRFTDTSTPGASDITTWRWSSGDGQFADTQHTAFAFSAEGSYAVALTVTDSNDLSQQVTTTVSCSIHRKHGLRCS